MENWHVELYVGKGSKIFECTACVDFNTNNVEYYYFNATLQVFVTFVSNNNINILNSKFIWVNSCNKQQYITLVVLWEFLCPLCNAKLKISIRNKDRSQRISAGKQLFYTNEVDSFPRVMTNCEWVEGHNEAFFVCWFALNISDYLAFLKAPSMSNEMTATSLQCFRNLWILIIIPLTASSQLYSLRLYQCW